MAVYKNSRYRGVKYTSVKFQDGSRKVFLHSRTPVTADDILTPITVFNIREQDTLDMLAKRRGSDEKKWWILADINEVLFPLELEDNELYVPHRTEFSKRG